jgi:hypothetical protein
MLLRTARAWFRALIYLDFLGMLAWAVVAVALGSFFLVGMLLGGEVDRAPILGFLVAFSAMLLVYFAWMTRDAELAYNAIHREHQKAVLRPECELREAVNLPHLPPWMGVLGG